MIESIYWLIRKTFLRNICGVVNISFPIFLIILVFKIFRKNKKPISIYRCIVEFTFLGYIVTVLLLTEVLPIKLDNFNTMHITPTLIPLLTTIQDTINNPSAVVQQVLLNILFFVPFGILFMMLYKDVEKKFLKLILLVLLFTLSLECIEFFSGRYMDIDDILWNTSGAILGKFIYDILFNIVKSFNMIKKNIKIKNLSNKDIYWID